MEREFVGHRKHMGSIVVRGGHLRVGVTGTRKGMTGAQRKQVLALVGSISTNSRHPVEFHHGDCVGVDDQVNRMVRHYNWKTISHPGYNPNTGPGNHGGRANSPSDIVLSEKPFLERNSL